MILENLHNISLFRENSNVNLQEKNHAYTHRTVETYGGWLDVLEPLINIVHTGIKNTHVIDIEFLYTFKCHQNYQMN